MGLNPLGFTAPGHSAGSRHKYAQVCGCCFGGILGLNPLGFTAPGHSADSRHRYAQVCGCCFGGILGLNLLGFTAPGHPVVKDSQHLTGKDNLQYAGTVSRGSMAPCVAVKDCYATTTGWARKGADEIIHTGLNTSLHHLVDKAKVQSKTECPLDCVKRRWKSQLS